MKAVNSIASYRFSSVTGVVFALVVTLPAIGQVTYPSASREERRAKLEERRTNVVNRIRALETEPLGAQAEANRRWLVSWRPEDLGITVKVCSDLIEGETRTSSAAPNFILISQFGFSAARFMLENRKLANDEKAVNLAALEGLLQVYARLVEQDPSVRTIHFDDLLKRRDAGTLREFVDRSLRRGCRAKRVLSPIL